MKNLINLSTSENDNVVLVMQECKYYQCPNMLVLSIPGYVENVTVFREPRLKSISMYYFKVVHDLCSDRKWS